MMYFLMFVLFILAVALILLILVQRGKGGGLAGAFGGMGGQSAFGTKAGDAFTKITIGVATTWILVCIISVRLLATREDRLEDLEDGLNPGVAGEAVPGGETSEGGSGEAPGTSNTPPAESSSDDDS